MGKDYNCDNGGNEESSQSLEEVVIDGAIQEEGLQQKDIKLKQINKLFDRIRNEKFYRDTDISNCVMDNHDGDQQDKGDEGNESCDDESDSENDQFNDEYLEELLVNFVDHWITVSLKDPRTHDLVLVLQKHRCFDRHCKKKKVL